MVWRPLDERTRDIGLAVISMEGVVLKCNRAFAEIFLEDRHTIIGRSVPELTAAEDQQRTRDNFQALVDGRVEFIRQLKVYKRRDGTTVQKMCQSHCVEDDGVPALFSLLYEPDQQDEMLKLTKALEAIGELTKGGVVVNNHAGDKITGGRDAWKGDRQEGPSKQRPSLIVIVLIIAAVFALLEYFIEG